MSTNENETLKSVVGFVLSVRGNGPGADRGATARIRAGLNPETEHRAYGDILPLLPPGTSRPEEAAYLRSAALVASHPKLGQTEKGRYPLGSTCRRFSVELAKRRGADKPYEVDPGKPDNIAFRLGQLPDEDLDGATLALNRILTLGDDLDVGLDYFDLARTLVHWGHGTTSSSMSARRKPLRDYYRHSQKPPAEKENK